MTMGTRRPSAIETERVARRPSAGALESPAPQIERAQALQTRLYFILEKLQVMASELPSKYKQRIPHELLSGLANTLLHDTIFDIVNGLKEIQTVTERQLFQSRCQLVEKHRQQVEAFNKRRPPTAANYPQELKILKERQKREMKQFEMKIILQMDQKVSDQQVMLEKAGVPGFYVTNNPPEIRVQMFILDFILRLSVMDLPRVFD